MRGRACVYCPEPDADCCVRVQRSNEGGAHIYAHRTCASERGVIPLYVFVDEPAARPR